MSNTIRKILASDYDGTLRRNGQIDPKDLEAIRRFREAGHWFGIVTGRAYDMIANELTHFGVETDFLICNNGSVVFDHHGNPMIQINMDQQLALDLIDWLDQEPDVLFGACDGKHYFSQMNGTFSATMKNELIHASVTTKEAIKASGTITAFFTRKFTDELTQQMMTRLDHDFDHRLGMHPNGGTIDIGPLGITKSTAILALQARFPKDLIITIGDHLNDMDMVRDFHGFAMADGHDDLKKVASHLVSNLVEAIELLNHR